MNVVIAFLNLFLKKTIYVEQSKEHKKKKYDLIYFLLKTLYNFKQLLRE